MGLCRIVEYVGAGRRSEVESAEVSAWCAVSNGGVNSCRRDAEGRRDSLAFYVPGTRSVSLVGTSTDDGSSTHLTA